MGGDAGSAGALTNEHRTQLLRAVVWATLAWGPLFVGIYLWLDLPTLALVAALATGGVALAPWAVRKTGRVAIGVAIVAVAFLGSIAVNAYYTGGAASPIMPWLAVVPLVAIAVSGLTRWFVWLIAAAFVQVAWALAPEFGLQPIQVLPIDSLNALYALTVVGVCTCVALVVFLFERAVQRSQSELTERDATLRTAADEISILRGLLRVCMHCKKIRDDEQGWVPMETYLGARSEAEFTHGLCDVCYLERYPGAAQRSGGSGSDCPDT